MARRSATGAEYNTNNEISTVSVGANSSFGSSALQAYSGSRSWRASKGVTVVAEAANGQLLHNSSSLSNARSFHFALYVDTLNTTDVVIFRSNWFLGGQEWGEVLISNIDATTYSIRARADNGVGVTETTTITLQKGRWYPILFRGQRDFSGTNDRIELRANRTTVNVVHIRFTAGNGTETWFGLVSSHTEAATVYIDDIICEGNSYIDITDDRFLAAVEPNGAVSTQWALLGGGSSLANIVDESDATGIRASGSSTFTDRFELSDISGTLPSAFVLSTIFLIPRHGDALDLGSWSIVLEDSSNTPLASVTVNSETSIKTDHDNCLAYTPATPPGQTTFNTYRVSLRKQSVNSTDHTSIYEAFGYVEVASDLNANEPVTASESNEVTAGLDLAETFVASEMNEVGVDIQIANNVTASDTFGVEADVSLTDGAAASETESKEQFSQNSGESAYGFVA